MGLSPKNAGLDNNVGLSYCWLIAYTYELKKEIKENIWGFIVLLLRDPAEWGYSRH